MVNLEETLVQGVKDQRIPHAVVCATNTDASWTYTYRTGNAVHGTDSPISDDAEFMLASSTKLLTTIAALQLVEKDLWGLDDDVSSQLPELAEQPILRGFDGDDEPILEERKADVTLRLLLTHSSGCVYDAGAPDIVKYMQRSDPSYKPNTGKTMRDRFLYPLQFQPGESWSYGTGMDWAGQLVESICGITLEDYIRDNISAPLGITSFTFNPYTNGELSKKVPHLTVRHKGGKLALNPEALVASGVKDGFGGHGGCASMPDYLKALHSILANDGKLLKPETVEMMFTPQLSEHCVEALRECISSPMGALFIGEWKPEKSKLDWGLGGILLMQDYEAGRRKKGTLCWGGVANTFWIIDRETDLALTFGTQVLPPGDKGAEEMITAVELGVYEMVNREST